MSTVLNNVSELLAIAHDYRTRGLVIGLCHGCFDIVHAGHIHHLKQAKAMVDRLFVSVTADAFVNKGPQRPIFSDQCRVEFLAAIRYCDHAIINHAATAQSLIEVLSPDLFFKGADYCVSADPRLQSEAAVVESSGGHVVLTDSTVLDSTSRLALIISSMGM
ncbi:adenylyltransferase/cytidyltransferase family protein [Pseudomonas sp. 18175]|uniref:adenylyltransferase/cytidyltransferase family protein n=1 Tax=Pseudomonas sp. 18175 TaxID=3390056 RepID=UPI003D1D555A